MILAILDSIYIFIWLFFFLLNQYKRNESQRLKKEQIKRVGEKDVKYKEIRKNGK